jgi:hypothetical protein
MAGLIALLLLGLPQASVAAQPPPEMAVERCLPGNAGFLSMRLRGSIEADVEWREPDLDCTGMPRPDGRGLRLRFAGPLPDNGALAIVFAAPELGMGVSARSVPVNVTLIDEAGERIYGTQGGSRCLFDKVEQLALTDPLLPPRSFRVSARGFCTVPARALDGDGAVLLTRFDFAGLVTYSEKDAAAPATPALFPDLPRADIQVISAGRRHDFKVWIADTAQSRERGLMFVKALPADHGMLFLFDRPHFASFWMKNTYVSLDIVFIAADGVVVNIATNTPPLSLEPIESDAPVTAVLELVAGTAARIGLVAGDRVRHPAFATP